jgi:hypothetical protein
MADGRWQTHATFIHSEKIERTIRESTNEFNWEWERTEVLRTRLNMFYAWKGKETLITTSRAIQNYTEGAS